MRLHRLAALLAAFAPCAVAPACTTVELPEPGVRVVPLELAGRVEVDPASAGREVAFRHAAAGIANRYTVRVGDALETYAEAFLGRALRDPGGADRTGGEGDGRDAPVTVSIAIEEAEIRGFALFLTTAFTVERGGAVVLSERYEVQGPPYFEGAPGTSERRMASIALRRTTHDALALTLREFLVDLRAWLAAERGADRTCHPSVPVRGCNGGESAPARSARRAAVASRHHGGSGATGSSMDPGSTPSPCGSSSVSTTIPTGRVISSTSIRHGARSRGSVSLGLEQTRS